MAGSCRRPPGNPRRTPPAAGRRPPQLPFGLRLGRAEKVLPHRRAGDDDLLRMAVVLAAFLKAHHHAPGIGLQHLGGEAGDHVGLVDRRGDAGLAAPSPGDSWRSRRCPPPRPGGSPQDGPGSWGRISMATETRLCQVAWDGRNSGSWRCGPSGRGILPLAPGLFPVPARAHEQNLGFGVFLLQPAAPGRGRVHMARRAAAGEDDTMQFGFTHKSRSRTGSKADGYLPCVFVCLDTDSTIPISASWMDKAVPP